MNGRGYVVVSLSQLVDASRENDSTISKVEFFHGGTNLIGTDLTSPYSFNWTGVAAGTYTVTAVATAVKKNQPNQTQTSAPITVIVNGGNVPPTVSMTSPANNAVFAAPGSITLTATASDSDGTITKVEFFHGGTNLIATDTTAPYTFDWTGVAAGSYSLTAKATDNLNGTTTSSPVNITVNAGVALYFIHTDHLNTPRLIANDVAQTVWQWDTTDPFANNAPNENPSGLGTFTCNLRLPGQYYDQETNLHYNYFRDYDPAIGRYIQSDPIGLEGGINTYGYVDGNPLNRIDPLGLIPIAPPIVACAANPVCVTLVAGTAIAAGNAIIGTINAFNSWSASSSSRASSSRASTSSQLVCGPNNDDPCDELHRIDTDTCNAITRRQGPAAGAICHASAGHQLGECKRFGIGGVTTPLAIWNN